MLKYRMCLIKLTPFTDKKKISKSIQLLRPKMPGDTLRSGEGQTIVILMDHKQEQQKTNRFKSVKQTFYS